MKEKLTRNLGIKLIAVFCAFFVWLAVVNVANPSKMATREVPVTILNESVLEEANLTYEVVGKKTATISFKVRTKDDYKIKASDFNAYADLSEMYDVTGAIPIRVEVVNNEELLESTPVVKSPEVLKVTTEELQIKQFALQAYPQGTVADGYQQGAVSMVPSQVSVKGPVSQVGQISTVGIEFSVEGASSDVSGTATPMYFDANGNRLEGLEESVKTIGGDISYTMQVLKVKEVPLDFVVTGEVASGYRYTGPECSVKSISVAGLKSALADVNTITIQDPSLSIAGASQDKVCEIDLKDFVDPSLTIVGLEDTSVEVTLKIEALTERTFLIEDNDITLDGADSDYQYEIGDGQMSVIVRGLKEDLDSLSVDKMNIHADVSGLSPGEHTVTAELELDDAFEIVSYPGITVRIEDRTSQSAADNSGAYAGETSAGSEEDETAAGE